MNEELPLALGKGAFTTNEAKEYGLYPMKLSRMVKEGVLERVGRGVYQSSDFLPIDLEADFKTATTVCKMPCAIGLLSALEYYDLTEEVTRKTWVLVDHTKRISHSSIRTVRLRNPKWEIGIVKEEGFWITSLERTVVECLLHKKILGMNVVLSALKTSVGDKKTKVSKLLEMAKKMGISHRVQSYLEMVSV